MEQVCATTKVDVWSVKSQNKTNLEIELKNESAGPS